MWKRTLLIGPACLSFYFSIGQSTSYYAVSDNQEFDKIKFTLNSTDGYCQILPGPSTEIFNVQKQNKSNQQPQYVERIVGRTKEINLKLAEGEQSSIGSSISRRFFSTQQVDDFAWKVYLSNIKPLTLDLNYAVGDTYIDLSDLPIERMKMKTGSANVKVNYKYGYGNRLEMDTFLIKVDMGSFEAKNLHLCRSHNIIADVGFGSVRMDFANASAIHTDVKASVGAGKLEVVLPRENIPVKISINESPLCRIKIPASFTQVSKNEFVSGPTDTGNMEYLSFNLDVAVGNIIFK